MPNEKNLEKRVPFKKGDPRINRKGAPKKIPALDTLLAELLDDEDQSAKLILAALIDKAKEGDVRAAQVILDRAYGKPKESIEYSNPDGTMKPKTTIIFSDGSKRDSNNDTSKV